MKQMKIVYWTSTGFIFLFEGVMPAFTGHSTLAKSGILHLGYPEYFVTILVVCKVMGASAILFPQVPRRIKEWAYAGLTFNLLCASTSLWAVDGLNVNMLFPMIILTILVASYISRLRLAAWTQSPA
jgi:hypothetical protein